MRPFILPLLIGATLAAGAPLVELAAAPVKNPSLRFWFGDNPGDKIGSDLAGLYQNGMDGVTAYIDKGDRGRLVIYESTQSTRTIRFTFDPCLPTKTCDEVPFTSSLIRPQLIAVIKNADGTTVTNGMLGMAVGTAGGRLANLKSYLGDINSAFWTLCMTTNNADGFCGISDNSTPMRVVRTAPNTWTFTASAGTTRSDVGELYKETGNRQRVISLEGTYSMPFTLTVQCVNAADCP